MNFSTFAYILVLAANGDCQVFAFTRFWHLVEMVEAGAGVVPELFPCARALFTQA